MSVIAEFTVPASHFVLGRALDEEPSLAIEFDRVIPTGGPPVPYFWVVGEDRTDFDAALERDPVVSTFAAVDELEDRTLYRASWDPGADAFFQLVEAEDIVLMEAGGTPTSWWFKFRSPDLPTLMSFRAGCREAGIDVTLRRLFDLVEPDPDEHRDLTQPQRNLLEYALDQGYFEVPRRTTLMEMAETLDISDQAVNERLRRGLSNLLERSL